MTRSTKRIYDGEVTEVFGPESPGDDTSYTYSAQSVNTTDRVVVTDVEPYRRVLYSELANRPKILPAEVGDPCELWVNRGEVKLLLKTEQYVVGDCSKTPKPGV